MSQLKNIPSLYLKLYSWVYGGSSLRGDWIPKLEKFIPSSKIRFGSFAVLFVVWIISTVLFFAGPASLTYLSIIFFWALPPIALQLLFGADILWRHRKLAALTILPMALYLSVVDLLAITASTWTIAPDQSTGILLGGVLPIEEAIFFIVTVALVTFGMTLFLAKETHDRMQEWFPKYIKIIES